MVQCSMNINYAVEIPRIVAKDALKEYTSIGTNKTAGTLMSAV